MALQSGDIVDRYRLDEQIGAGAYGEVWRASQLAGGEPIGITCALKVMRFVRDRSGSSPHGLPTGWLDEAQHLVKVAGNTVPRIHEANVWHEHAYIAMELLAGSTLRERLGRGTIAWRRALFIADQIATALEAAHQLGLVHRDLKPQNVMLVDAKRCCVLDWGIARLHTGAPPRVESGLVRQPTTDLETTDVAEVVAKVPQQVRVPGGTPGYMAPEVYDGAPPTPAQDAYSLGVVLYEMLAGCLPHAVDPALRNRNDPDAGKAYRAALDKATQDHATQGNALVPLCERCPELPVAVTELVDSLLEADPARRPAKLRLALSIASRFAHGIPDPPYAGLSTLGLAHAGLYYGQRDAVRRVLEHLEAHRAALLWGPSGSGKSSLALAGVAATMDRTLFLDLDGWDVHVVRPRDGKDFHAVPGTPRPRRPGIGQLVLIDQLEEVVDLSPAARAMFCTALLALLDRTDAVTVREAVISVDDHVRVIATIRDDLEWRVDREVPVLRPLLDQRLIVQGVDVNLARSIIEEPARALGFTVEDLAAVTREVEDRLSAEPAKLPIVQYALSEWWERRDVARKRLPADAWQQLGGVDGALSFVAEHLFASLEPAQQQRMKALFLRLFRGGRKQPLVESGLSEGDRVLLDKLGGVRLVGRHDKQGSEPFYEVEHEYLSTNWLRLAAWLGEAREDRALIEELERDAAAYLADQDAERLWRKARLATALELSRRARLELNAAAKDFLHQAQRRERSRSWALRGTIAAVVIAALLMVYGAVLQAAVSRQREQVNIELVQAQEASTAAAKLEAERAKALEAAKKTAGETLRAAESEAARITDAANQRRDALDAAITKAQQDSEAQLEAAIAARDKAQRDAKQAETWARNSMLKAEEAEERAKRADAQGTRSGK